MMLNIEPIKNWFGFTRRERRSSFILLIVVFVILGLRVAVPDKNIDIEDITDSIQLYSITNGIQVSDAFQKVKHDTTARKRIPANYRKWPLISLNSCDTSQLISLPGIGPVLSVRIIKYRNLLGGYATVEQLREVYGLSSETFELIKSRVFADTALLTRININTAGYKELAKLPYFENYEVNAILKYRELKGRIDGMNDLTDNKLVAAEKGSKIMPYLNFK